MIDENGKLFGKINLIDLIIVILVLALVAFVAIKVINRQDPEADYKQVEISFYSEEVPDYVTEYLQQGDSVLDFTENITMGTVVNFELGAPQSYLTGTSGDVQRVEKEGYKSVSLTAATSCTITEHGALIGGTLYGVGNTMVIFSGKAKLWVKLSSIEVIA